MADHPLQECFERLGLTPEASTREVEKAFRELCDLYCEESLATYSLFDYSDRQEKLEQLQDAFDRILQLRLQPTTPPGGEAADDMPVAARIICVDADPQSTPGAYLQQMREARGLSLHDVAERTKVGSFQLQSIEQQRFDVLPAPVYLRGFLREFARVIEAPDVDALVEGFMALYQAAQG